MGRTAGFGASVAVALLMGSSAAAGAGLAAGTAPTTTATSVPEVASTTGDVTATTVVPTTTTRPATSTTAPPEEPSTTTTFVRPTSTIGAEGVALPEPTTTTPPPGCLAQSVRGGLDGTFSVAGPFDDEVPVTADGTGPLRYLGTTHLLLDMVGRTAGEALNLSGNGTITSEAGDELKLRVVGTAGTSTGVFALQLTAVGGTGPLADMRGTVVARGNAAPSSGGSTGYAGNIHFSVEGELLYGSRCSALALPRTGGPPDGLAVGGLLAGAVGAALLAGARRERRDDRRQA